MFWGFWVVKQDLPRLQNMGLVYSPVLGRPQALKMGHPIAEPRVAAGCVN